MVDLHPLIAALQPLIDAAGAQSVGASDVDGSDVPLVWGGNVVGGVRLPPIHGSLNRIVARVEAEMRAPLPTLNRLEKQEAIRRLDELGAFVLRRAVEDVSEAVGISRITVYSYLNALHR
ncbi:MAG: helix-turn-helix domain-containing protein [Actinomycetota bacterium]|uniref:helix-turn-helix domain-containing protein n=1 Tax=uncultured Ilumatobacter sp. TaxID=879968 RepID=UPI00374F6B86|nr:helix-turn-helix domain-containing protein [Actinomycetota bacterium]